LDTSKTGWWFGTCFIFHHIWNVILPIDELIFFKMVITTNQGYMLFMIPSGKRLQFAVENGHRKFVDLPINKLHTPLKKNGFRTLHASSFNGGCPKNPTEEYTLWL